MIFVVVMNNRFHEYIYIYIYMCVMVATVTLTEGFFSFKQVVYYVIAIICIHSAGWFKTIKFYIYHIIYIKLKSCLSVHLSTFLLLSVDYLANRCTYQNVFYAKWSAHHQALQSLLKQVSNRSRLPSTTHWTQGCRRLFAHKSCYIPLKTTRGLYEC